jgi:uncharacterized protein
MKRLIVLIFCLWGAIFTLEAAKYRVDQIPNVQLLDASRYTSNPDKILSESAVMAIDKACDSLHTAGKAQIAVVVVEDIESDDVFSFAYDLFSEWGVGGRKSDNGLGVILVVEKREIRFVTGYGLEAVLPDAVCKRIQQRYMVEHLAKGDYDAGMVEGVAAVAKLLSDDAEVLESEELTDEEFFVFMGVFVLLVVVIIVVAFVAEWMSRRCPKCGQHHLRRKSTNIISSSVVKDVVEHSYLCSNCGYAYLKRETIHKPTVVVSGGGRGGFGGGSFGGGFGGGSFGGGGAGSRF